MPSIALALAGFEYADAKRFQEQLLPEYDVVQSNSAIDWQLAFMINFSCRGATDFPVSSFGIGTNGTKPEEERKTPRAVIVSARADAADVGEFKAEVGKYHPNFLILCLAPPAGDGDGATPDDAEPAVETVRELLDAHVEAGKLSHDGRPVREEPAGARRPAGLGWWSRLRLF
ncbi:uncharacterized protein B0H64DRAFT_468792 [Chaetomium fimeti]|uniref:Uncharacterized protein n=1 Tax=Chaetomium fimeti TaxID=1854472 RepID=A0AAE0H8J6_9PEZI|nr:hypothetical protein B0H64DRAFT_468792 [Chaetomium fimeti]